MGEGRMGTGRRMVRLPDRFHVQQTAAMVSIADSAGAPLETIAIGASGDASGQGGDVPQFSGVWKEGRLSVVHQGRRGKVTQTYSVEEHGQRLLIETKMEAEGTRPSREFKRVYRRVST